MTVPTIELIAQLSSDSAIVRLGAARQLSNRYDSSLLTRLTALRARELDSWVCAALDQVIERWRSGDPENESGQAWISIPSDRAADDIRADAIQTVSRTLIHELSPLIGGVATAAEAELESFPESETNTRISRLRDFLRTVEKLNQAAGSPRFAEFDLIDAIEQVIDVAGLRDRVTLGREDPLVCVGDKDLLALALGVVVNNAVEATIDGSLVIITADVTDRETWIRVLDEGVGLPNGSNKVFAPGRTTKPKSQHFGWGLSIAQRAVHSFGGNIALLPRSPVGTSCEISWPIDGSRLK